MDSKITNFIFESLIYLIVIVIVSILGIPTPETSKFLNVIVIVIFITRLRYLFFKKKEAPKGTNGVLGVFPPESLKK